MQPLHFMVPVYCCEVSACTARKAHPNRIRPEKRWSFNAMLLIFSIGPGWQRAFATLLVH